MQKTILILLLANLVISGLDIWDQSSNTDGQFQWPEIDTVSQVSYTYEAELVEIIDGDTVTLDIDLGFEHWLHNQRMRLYGIDAPETRTKDLEEKKRGKEAARWLTNRLNGKEVVVQSIQNEKYDTDQKDSFGRWLAILFVEGVNINEEMVEKGVAVRWEG